MKYCSKCGTQMKDEDKFCYKCGNQIEFKNETNYDKAQTDKLISYVIITGFMVMFIIISIIMVSNSNETSNKNYGVEKESNIDTEIVTEKISDNVKNYDIEEDIDVFVSTYYNNELDGNKKYYGKRIKLTGELNNIDTDDSVIVNLGITCYLKTTQKLDVACNFKDGDATYLSDYSRGEKITIIGTVDEVVKGFPKNLIYLKKCEVIK